MNIIPVFTVISYRPNRTVVFRREIDGKSDSELQTFVSTSRAQVEEHLLYIEELNKNKGRYEDNYITIFLINGIPYNSYIDNNYLDANYLDNNYEENLANDIYDSILIKYKLLENKREELKRQKEEDIKIKQLKDKIAQTEAINARELAEYIRLKNKFEK